MDSRRIAFCVQLAAGKSAQVSARTAGYSESYAISKAYQLARDPDVMEMVHELRERAKPELALEAAAVVNEIGAIALVNPIDYLIKETRDGVDCYRWKKPEELSPMQRAAVKSVRLKDNMIEKDDGVTIRKMLVSQEYSYTLHGKAQALEMLGKHFGIFTEDSGPGVVTDEFTHMPHEKMVQAMNFLKDLRQEEAEE